MPHNIHSVTRIIIQTERFDADRNQPLPTFTTEFLVKEFIHLKNAEEFHFKMCDIARTIVKLGD